MRSNALARAQLPLSNSELRTHPLRGFTLVEMLIVIVIIGVLMGLAIPAMMAVRVRVNEARVATEIKNLESAISAFRSKYGIDPPSKFIIYLTQAGWNSDPANMAIIRRIWPQFDFTMTMPDPANPPNGTRGAYPVYWNGIATSVGGNQALQINSSECLLFFLGGVMGDNASGPNQVPTGFAKNPVWPFAPAIGTAFANREGPFFEFTDISRVRSLDPNGMNEWYDSIPNQTMPLLYFSSYDGAGYRVTGSTTELPSAPGFVLADVYRVWSPPTGTPNAPPPIPGAATQALPAQKGQSFQIISPGYDGLYGFGGVFNKGLTNSGLVTAGGTPGAPDKDAFDNITNFSGGRLN